MKNNKIAIAADHGGVDLKSALITYLREHGVEIVDLGTNDTQSVDYPDYADAMARWIVLHNGSMGILICGSGIGMSIAINRHRHIRAALCSEALSAKLSRKHNDANVICLGARIIGIETAKDCVKKFITTEFESGRHTARVEKLSSFVKRK